MLPQENGTNQNSQPTLLGGTFTAEERACLEALRQWYHTHPEYADHGIDSRRLEFARWLVAHGKLSEDC